MSENENDTSDKAAWTGAEKAEVAAKFDKELKDYVEVLERQRVLEEWGEDRYYKELEKHPYYNRKPPENATELSDLMERLQQLKLSMKYNTPNELAQIYKEDGNRQYKNKEYSLAEYSFGKGIKIASECKDYTLLTQLYNNRALAFFKMKMYRQSLIDCKKAIKINPEFLKPMHIAAKCCYHIKNYDQCISYCDQILDIESKNNDVNEEIVSLKARAVESNSSPKTDSTLKEIKEKTMRKNILDAIKSRNIKLDESDIFYDSQAVFRVQVEHVHLDEKNFLVWPVFFKILEYDYSILIQDFHEIKTFSWILKDCLNKPPLKDNKQYQVGKLHVYYDGVDGKSYKIDIEKCLGQILQEDKFIVRHGAPAFDVLVANSKTEADFLLMTVEQKQILGHL